MTTVPEVINVNCQDMLSSKLKKTPQTSYDHFISETIYMLQYSSICSDVFRTHIYKGKMQHISYLLTLVSVPSRYLAAQLSSLHIRMNTNFPIYVASKSDGNMRYSNMPVKQGLDESSRASIQHTNTQQSSFQK